VLSLYFFKPPPVFSAFYGNRAGDVFEGFLKSALNFASQELLNFDWHKVLYTFSLLQLQKWTVIGNQKKSETAIVKSILENFFSVFS